MNSLKLTYRPEIDGLRAVAVLPVILFHTGLHWMPGGYVGVDVFFVISGFLITGILMRELEAGTFSILRFYERRARRILPALFLVMAVTAVLSMIFLLPSELRDFARSMIAVITFLSNFFFWLESDYFATASEKLPLLHTWSLSVEEQFYILFPLALWLLWRFWRGGLVLSIVLVLFVSLMLAEALVHRLPTAAFYLLPTRAWELLAGSLAAIYLFRHAQPRPLLGECVGGLGFLAILYSVLVFDKGTPFPSLWTVIPVLGTVGILIGASERSIIGRFLSLRPIVFIGLISYSAYLWHQPLFAFARITAPGDEPAGLLMISLAVLSLFLAWGTWRFVERPFRRKDLFSARQIFVQSSVGTAVLAGLAAVFLLSQGLVQRFPEDQRTWLVQSREEYAVYMRAGHSTAMKNPLSDTKPNLVLVGDSFSQDFYNMIQENGAFADHSISAVRFSSSCQLSFGFTWEDTRSLIPEDKRASCARQELGEKEHEMIQGADVVIFAFSWRDWSARRMAKVLENLDLNPEQKVFVIGSKRMLPRRKILELDDLEGARAEPPANDIETTKILKETLPNDVFVDTLALVCPGGCPLFTADGALISYDSSHLTNAGARYVGSVLFDKSQLSAYRQ